MLLAFVLESVNTSQPLSRWHYPGPWQFRSLQSQVNDHAVSQLLSLYCSKDGISCSIHMQSAAHCSAMLHISSSHLWLQKWMVDNIHHKLCNSSCRQVRQTNSHSSVTRPLMRIYWRADGGRSVGLQSVLLHITSYLTPRVLPWPRKPRLDQYLLSSCSSIPRPDFTN